MKKALITLYLLITSFQVAVAANNTSRTLILTRTNTDLATENNQLIVKLGNNGNVELSFPVTHLYHSSIIKLNNQTKSATIFQLSDGINKDLTTRNLKHDLVDAKKQSADGLFYSSDTDIIHLQSLTNNQVDWQISISGIQELKHYYHSLGQWQPLIDLIEQMESLSLGNDVLKQWENR